MYNSNPYGLSNSPTHPRHLTPAWFTHLLSHPKAAAPGTPCPCVSLLPLVPCLAGPPFGPFAARCRAPVSVPPQPSVRPVLPNLWSWRDTCTAIPDTCTRVNFKGQVPPNRHVRFNSACAGGQSNSKSCMSPCRALLGAWALETQYEASVMPSTAKSWTRVDTRLQ